MLLLISALLFTTVLTLSAMVINHKDTGATFGTNFNEVINWENI
jgi:hypothetical protein